MKGKPVRLELSERGHLSTLYEALCPNQTNVYTSLLEVDRELGLTFGSLLMAVLEYRIG